MKWIEVDKSKQNKSHKGKGCIKKGGNNGKQNDSESKGGNDGDLKKAKGYTAVS